MHDADTISYYTITVALMYLGVTPFPISTRNSAIAVAHLVAKTGVKQMFVSADAAMQRLAHEANELLAKEGREFEVLPMPTFEDMYGPGGDDALVPMGDVSPDMPCIILHSSGEWPPVARLRVCVLLPRGSGKTSIRHTDTLHCAGSTAFPKPIKFLDKNFRKWGTLVCGCSHSLDRPETWHSRYLPSLRRVRHLRRPHGQSGESYVPYVFNMIVLILLDWTYADCILTDVMGSLMVVWSVSRLFAHQTSKCRV